MMLLTYASLAMALTLGVLAADTRIHIVRELVLGFSVLSVLLFTCSDRLSLIISILLIVLLVTCYLLKFTKQKWLYLSLFVICCLFSFLLAIHSIPGIENVQLYNNVTVSEGAPAFNLNANFDKGIAGIVLLLLITSRSSGLIKYVKNWLLIPIVWLVLFFIAWLTGLGWEPKWPEFTLVFFLVNLFFTCIAEEAFFRGFIQQRLQHVMIHFKHGQALALCLTSLLFGLVHFSGGIPFVVLATLAGFGYGVIYNQTGKLSAAILVHFGLNALHFTLLTYPVPL
ncbi:CPBP family intramembrane glutamic endopeptidase [Zooshikella sp. RANM57]|uniref:CPBP family intramembrane glutamic endopeptidase n=1 Tax=Zooshikella sp. RANM57 TaxID=3425863 RepID=UPI003D6FE77E